MYLKKIWILILFISSTSIISQKKHIKNHTFFIEKIKNNYSNENELLKKTSDFFINQQWDSVIVSTAKVNYRQNVKAEHDYFLYMRAYSFMLKNLYSEAQLVFERIPHNFQFYNKVLYALSCLMLEQSQFQKALSYLKKIETTELTSADEIEKTSLFNDLGVCYLHLKNYDKANEYLAVFLKLVEQKRNDKELSEAYSNIANLYYEQYKDDIAISYFTKAYEISKKNPDNEIKRLTAKNMAVVEENRKNFKKALRFRKESEKWRDSVYNQEKIYNTAKLEKKILKQQKENEIAILKLENKAKGTQRNSFIVTSLLLLLLLAMGSYFLIQKNKSHKIISSQKEELALLNQTKDKLFSVVSHDLRSSVNLMKKSNAKLLYKVNNKNYDDLGDIATKNASITNSSYNLLDNLLNWATMQTEQLYFQIESLNLMSVVNQVSHNYQPLFAHKELAFENSIKHSVFILADLDSLKIIIRNLLDNAIKFSNSGGIIKTYNISHESFEEFIIQDSGVGMTKETIIELQKESPLLSKKKNQNELGTGLGIQLCKSLIKKNNAQLFIESSPNKGSKFRIRFPKPTIHG